MSAGYQCKILADSVNAATLKRLTTFEVKYPRMVHAELMTHRLLSRNSASSRAIPIERTLERVLEDPAMPVWWGKNQRGMQAEVELAGEERELAEVQWLSARNVAVDSARRMLELGLHKQLVNRVVEPWMWITVIVTATDWTNFFGLRCHPAAQPEIRHIAEMMRRQYESMVPARVEPGDWHLPLRQPEDDNQLSGDLSPWDVVKVCTARCARVSYLTHDGRRDVAADLALHDRLRDSGHWSPFEHCAQAMDEPSRHGNFSGGWLQYRKTFEGEHLGGRLP